MGNQNSVRKHIEHAERTGVCQLANLGLKEFPDELRQLANKLRTLDLSGNKLQVLPETIGNFSSLKSLSLYWNFLETLPKSICKLRKLETLSLADNRLLSLPDDIGKLASLKTISLKGNNLSTIPTSLTLLRQLDMLDLSQNSIKSIPNEIQDLQAVEINLNQNQISSLPESLAACPRLKVLRLQENCLTLQGIPEVILAESKISLIVVDGNLFDQKSFQSLNGHDKYMERYTATKKKFD